MIKPRELFGLLNILLLLTPPGNFSIWLRAYWPDQTILDGTWKPPVIKIAK